jgi:hypothetical protein
MYCNIIQCNSNKYYVYYIVLCSVSIDYIFVNVI